MQDKTGPACGKVPFVQLFFTAALCQLDYERWIRKKVLEGVRDVAPGAIVKQIRSSTGLSQRNFAESIGICQSAVGYYESGKHRVSDVIWEKIKSVYHDVIVQLAIPEEIPDEGRKQRPPEAETLRRIRCASGLSQREFAESIGISKSVIGNCESGIQGLSDRVWARIKEKYPDCALPREKVDGQGDEQGDVRAQDDVRNDNQMAVGRRAPTIIIQSPTGAEITPKEIVARVGEAEKIYVRVDHNAAYWVRGEETGKAGLW